MPYSKDFDSWNEKKKQVHHQNPYVFFKEREVWFASLGANVGFEQDGSGRDFLRPVIVFRKFNKQVAWVIPLTRTKKTGKFYFHLSFDGGDSVAILSQVRLLDGKRLRYKAGVIDKRVFRDLDGAFRKLLR